MISDEERDMELSIFGEILSTLCKNFDSVEAVVFHDAMGETIDYVTQIDAYATRVAGAHHGLIFQSAKTRFQWLDLGIVNRVSTYTDQQESITIQVDDETCITVISKKGTIDDENFEGLLEHVLNQLREEVG